ncbi:MAG: DoxX family membrane protein [Bacteroidales bacterium]|nr:DoxX family membrane protein [Bacteroidales bacterium]MDT8372432.1 DoxX family membrane protein [Bacteroidales bacterium]
MKHLTDKQAIWLVLLRLAIGWHFLYEGLVKVIDSNWSARVYLLDSRGPFSGLFHSMASNERILSVTDFLNEWGLLLIGLGLILGILSRWASYAGMLMLLFYYLSHPPFPGITYSMPAEGNYFIIDKVAIEFFALGVLALFPTEHRAGLARFFRRKDQNFE